MKHTKPSAVLVFFLSLTALAGCASQQSSNSEAGVPTSSANLEQQMMDAIDAGDPNAVQAILDQGLSPDAPIGGLADDPQLPLHLAAKVDQADVIVVLIDADATVDATSGGLTPLMLAASSAGAETVEALVQGGADMDIINPNWDGSTALHYAAREGNVEALGALLDAGFGNIDLQNTQKRTALMYAAIEGKAEAVEILVERGAELNIRDQFNTTARGWADYWGHTEIAEYLEAAGGVIF